MHKNVFVSVFTCRKYMLCVHMQKVYICIVYIYACAHTCISMRHCIYSCVCRSVYPFVYIMGRQNGGLGHA